MVGLLSFLICPKSVGSCLRTFVLACSLPPDSPISGCFSHTHFSWDFPFWRWLPDYSLQTSLTPNPALLYCQAVDFVAQDCGQDYRVHFSGTLVCFLLTLPSRMRAGLQSPAPRQSLGYSRHSVNVWISGWEFRCPLRPHAGNLVTCLWR